MSRICSDDPTHASNTDDFCSICGAPVNGQNVRQQSTQAFSSAVGSSACPTCGIASVPGDVFCANCGTEYATGRMIMPEPEPEAALHSATSAITSVSDSKTQADMASVNSPFRAILLIDLAPREGREIDALPPADCSERVFILDKEILPFGRTSSWMPIPDEGASRSHGEFLRHADGYYGLRDVGSANGTLLNGVPLKGQEIKRIKPGDMITIGFWHTIRIE